MKTTSFPPLLSLSLLLFSLPIYVSAHGFVTEITISGGRRFPGPLPNQGFRAPGQSIVRQVEDNNPVKGSFNPALTCGTNARPASQVADVNPGEELSFNWGSWPHRAGPLLVYMASCGPTNCDKFDASQARWFKISQLGQKEGSNEWFQNDIANGAPGRARIPPNLAPGNYLIRYEIIALHVAMSRGGVEFYPSCAQLRVGGSGTGYPGDNELVSLPGAYNDDHPGLFTPEIFQPGFRYTFPGPPVSRLAAGSPPPAGGAQQPPAPKPSSSKAAPAGPAPTGNNGNNKGNNGGASPVPPVAAAPIPTSSVPQTAPSPSPSPARRCKKRPNAKERRERAAERAAARAAAGAGSGSGGGSPSPSRLVVTTSPTPINLDAADVVDVKVVETPPVLQRRGHHSRVMRRLATYHSH